MSTDKSHDLIENYKKSLREESRNYAAEQKDRVQTGCLPILVLLVVMVVIIL
jgi:hypothetical protein